MTVGCVISVRIALMTCVLLTLTIGATDEVALAVGIKGVAEVFIARSAMVIKASIGSRILKMSLLYF